MRIDPIEHEGRLQRKATAGGKQITRFEQVLLRHGQFVLLLAALCLLVPQRNAVLEWGLKRFTQFPFLYLFGAVVLMGIFMGITRALHRKQDTRQMLWILYLLGVSICEEWVFRLAAPAFSLDFIGRLPAVLLCNLAFAAMHYFTLRWKVRWCVAAFFGAMGLTRLLILQQDLVLVIYVHWFVTFLNTPVPVGSNAVIGDASADAV